MYTLTYQKAFQRYLRYGISIDAQFKAAEQEATHYIWRTQGDDKVRAEHAAREGQIFAYDDPAVNPPGSEPGCRCRAVPYYGTFDPIYDPPIEPVYPEFIFLPLARFGRTIISLIRGIRDRAGTLNEAQAHQLKRFDKKLPKAAGEIKISTGMNGQRVFSSDVPARNIPGSFARYEKIVDSSGKTISYTKTTYAPDGSIVHVKLK